MLEVEFLINPQQAIQVDESKFFELMLEGLIQAVEKMELPRGFDFQAFKKDVSALQFEQLRQAA